MNSIYESIKFSSKMQMNIFIHSVNYVQNHWHESLEILFVLKGNVNIVIDDTLYNLNQEDVIVINTNEVHTVSSNDDNMILALQIPIDFIKYHYEDIENIKFNCNSVWIKNENKDIIDNIRQILAKTMWTYSKDEEDCEIKIQALVLELVYILCRNFKEKGSLHNKNSNKYSERLKRIIEYIDKNYKEDITLNSVAKREYLSSAYLSKFFSKYIGKNFNNYVNSIRLEQAVKDLIYTDLPITEVALSNGFSNEKTFFTLFKENYGQTPNSYRKKIKANLKEVKIKDKNFNYVKIDEDKIYTSLFKYLDLKGEVTENKIINKNNTNIDLSQEKEKIKHKWKLLTNIGRARDGLIEEVQNQLKITQREIGFKYIRFHGIFDDEMNVYDEDNSGNVILNFSYIDRLFDFLYSINLRPFIELGFMPQKLAKEQVKIFYRPTIISPPKDINKWNKLIEEFINHYIKRYGLEEVKTWYFEVWNEPEIDNFFGFKDVNEYYRLYENTYKTIKSISKGLKVGAPSINFICDASYKWTKDFYNFYYGKGIVPDFMYSHSYTYSMNIDLKEIDINALSENGIFPKDENFLYNYIKEIKEKTNEINKKEMDLYITEWNASPSHRELTHDTCYKSAFIVKNIVENMDSTESLAYWAITDFIEELRLPKEVFHGGVGLITINSIKKAAYNAFYLLSKLGNIFVDKGDGFYITKNSRGYQIILYNYCHFDKLYMSMDTSKITFKDRYNVFKNDNPKEFNFKLENINDGKYEIKEYRVNREQGSSFDAWVEMGAPTYLQAEEIKYLKGKSNPGYKRKNENVKKYYKINTILEPHEIVLYEINNL
ncbi:GH39 family glycosyl hydrolase [[Clostridium] dakarense]|uniref:GH39 family glycosyl hydrolase n=1 Tax=Faecalimicrobium dakarense TaxID=1301100 RepID=UPI0004BC5B69|nr:helix-turn-helix domain-containing protein [[Clostridium] dakarense]